MTESDFVRLWFYVMVSFGLGLAWYLGDRKVPFAQAASAIGFYAVVGGVLELTIRHSLWGGW